MTPEDITAAIARALVQGGRDWLVSTIAAFMPALWTLTLILHLARPYVFRTLRKLSVRFGADVWWLSYVLLRDAMLVLTFCLGFIFLMPDLLLQIDLPLTAPLATLFLSVTLSVKLLADADDDFRAYRLATMSLVVGASLYFVPQTLAIEGSSQSFLRDVTGLLDSARNPAWAIGLFAVALLGLVANVVFVFHRVVVRGSVAHRAPTAPRELPS